MTIHYQLTPEDYTQFQRDYLQYSVDGKRKMLRSRLWMVLACGGWLTIGITLHDTFSIVVAACMAIFFWFLFQTLWLRAYTKRIEKLKKDSTNRALFGETTLTLQPDGIHVTGVEADSIYKWNLVQQIIDSSAQISIYMSAVTALIIPNSAFASDVERKQFVETARRYREQTVGLELQ